MKSKNRHSLYYDAFILCVFLLCLIPQTIFAGGGDEVRNGGDHIRIIFNEGQSKAIASLKSLQIEDLETYISASTHDWLQKHAIAMAADLEQTRLVWNDQLPENCSHQVCACTGLKPKAIIYLSLSECNGRFVDSNYAAKLLIHEVVHHFGNQDETFADEVAIAVVDQRQKSRQHQLYASLDMMPMMAPKEKDDGKVSPSSQNMVLFLRQQGVVQARGGAGFSYNRRFIEEWFGEFNYSWMTTGYGSLIQSFGVGMRRYFVEKRISPYGFSRLDYTFESFEGEDMVESSRQKYGSLQLSLGLGGEMFLWEDLIGTVDIERVMASQSFGTHSTSLPAFDWSMRLGLGLRF